VIETGLAKQTTDRYPTAVEMAAAAREAITEPTGHAHPTAPTQQAPVPHGGLFVPPGPVLHYPPPQPPGAPPTPPPWSPAPPWSPPPPPPKRSSHKPLILIGAIAAVVLLVAAGVFATVQLTGHDKPATGAAPTTAGRRSELRRHLPRRPWARHRSRRQAGAERACFNCQLGRPLDMPRWRVRGDGGEHQ
jgi:serine/threonine-protein kinase